MRRSRCTEAPGQPVRRRRSGQAQLQHLKLEAQNGLVRSCGRTGLASAAAATAAQGAGLPWTYLEMPSTAGRWIAARSGSGQCRSPLCVRPDRETQPRRVHPRGCFSWTFDCLKTQLVLGQPVSLALCQHRALFGKLANPAVLLGKAAARAATVTVMPKEGREWHLAVRVSAPCW
jgi:hypothetical protein